MQITGTARTQNGPVPFRVRRYDRSGRLAGMTKDVQEEAFLSVFVNGSLSMQLGCSADHTAELVLGRLFSEGLIASTDEVAALSIQASSMRADVTLENPAAGFSAQKHAAAPLRCASKRPLEPVEPISWSIDQVFSMMDAFERDRGAHSRTRGTHSAYLWRDRELLCCREDIGRHNAFDKAVGYALMKDVDLAECAVFTSGRVPTDMATKAIRARLPLLVSKAAVTDKTVEIARAYDLALVCNARDGFIEVYNDPSPQGRTARRRA